jgi:prepilin-type N-terminal cleavage/methylation domain-containing protein
MLHKRGFSLIELLVVVSILGILSAIVSVNYDQGRKKAADAAIKADTREYRQAMELYYSKYKSYLVYDRSKNCDFTYETATAHGGFRLEGTGDGCVGYKGSGQGQMTRINKETTDEILNNYTPRSIADLLVSEGVLSAVYTFPESKDVAQGYTRVMLSGAQAPADFVLTVCDASGKQASSAALASTYAIFAQPLVPIAAERARAVVLCGAYPHGWNVLESIDSPSI